jgi:hypothetical protein
MYPKGCVLSCIRKPVRCKIARLNSETEHETERARVPLIKKLGPGLITGAADDDPSGIAHRPVTWLAVAVMALAVIAMFGLM